MNGRCILCDPAVFNGASKAFSSSNGDPLIGGSSCDSHSDINTTTGTLSYCQTHGTSSEQALTSLPFYRLGISYQNFESQLRASRLGNRLVVWLSKPTHTYIDLLL